MLSFINGISPPTHQSHQSLVSIRLSLCVVHAANIDVRPLNMKLTTLCAVLLSGMAALLAAAPTDIVAGNLNDQTAPILKFAGISPTDVSVSSFGPEGHRKNTLLVSSVNACSPFTIADKLQLWSKPNYSGNRLDLIVENNVCQRLS